MRKQILTVSFYRSCRTVQNTGGSSIENLTEKQELKLRELLRYNLQSIRAYLLKGAFSSGIVEGLNNKAKLTMRKSYSFREFRTIEMALYHCMGDLPEPPITHRFC